MLAICHSIYTFETTERGARLTITFAAGAGFPGGGIAGSAAGSTVIRIRLSIHAASVAICLARNASCRAFSGFANAGVIAD